MATEQPKADTPAVEAPRATTPTMQAPPASLPASSGVPTTAPATSATLPPSKPASPALGADAGPPKPPRPVSPNTANQRTLQEAFPAIEPTVIRAVLVASRGEVEPAFHALLSMSDPSAEVDTPPPQPPRPQARSPGLDLLTSTPQSQVEADALYARRLQERYGAAPGAGVRASPGTRGGANPNAGRRRQEQHAHDDDDDDYYYDSDKDHSFFDDDLPVITENIKKGFQETQSKFNSWFDGLKKKLDNDDDGTAPERSSSAYARSGSRRQTVFPEGGPHRSRDPHGVGYDADPQVLGDDFAQLHMQDNTETPQRRPKANPNLFQTSGGRKVAFDDHPTTIGSGGNSNDDDLYRSGSPAPKPAGAAASKPGSKWEPLKSVDPAPMDRDPFSLGDSDDEKEPAKEPKQETGVTKPTE